MSHNQEIVNRIDQNINQIQHLLSQKQTIWLNDVLFTWRWWLGVILSILPWLLWILYRRKESSDRYLFVAFIVAIISTALDVFGDQLGAWHYRYNVVPIEPTYFPWDFTLMPVAVITLLQIKPKANPVIKAVIFAIVSSYMAEPFFHWIDVYRTIHWRFTYSVPIQFCIYLLSDRIYHKDFKVKE